MGFANIGSAPRDLLAELFCIAFATAHRLKPNERGDQPTEHDYALADSVLKVLGEDFDLVRKGHWIAVTPDTSEAYTSR